MKLNVVFLVVIGVTTCAAVLLNPPKNANIVYKHDDLGRLVEIEIDHKDPAPLLPTPLATRNINRQKTRPTVQAAPKRVLQTMVPKPTFRKPAPSPIRSAYKAPTAAPKPVAAKKQTRTLYFIEDDDKLEQVFPVIFKLSSAISAPAPAPVAPKAPAPVPFRAPVPVAKKSVASLMRSSSVEDDSDEDDK